MKTENQPYSLPEANVDIVDLMINDIVFIIICVFGILVLFFAMPADAQTRPETAKFAPSRAWDDPPDARASAYLDERFTNGFGRVPTASNIGRNLVRDPSDANPSNVGIDSTVTIFRVRF